MGQSCCTLSSDTDQPLPSHALTSYPSISTETCDAVSASPHPTNTNPVPDSLEATAPLGANSSGWRSGGGSVHSSGRKQQVSFADYAEVLSPRSNRETASDLAALLAELPEDNCDGSPGSVCDASEDTVCNPLAIPLDTRVAEDDTSSARSVPITDALTPHVAQLAIRHVYF